MSDRATEIAEIAEIAEDGEETAVIAATETEVTATTVEVAVATATETAVEPDLVWTKNLAITRVLSLYLRGGYPQRRR
jgi:hypothetical protein